MNCLYWNIRGLANHPSRLALKNLILANKPNFIFISEPWIHFDSFPANWFHNLNYKPFAFNTRPDNIPNLWCFCLNQINPTVISSDSQQVSFTFVHNHQHFCISAVYASTNHITRRHIWLNLQTIQTNLNMPWCAIGDFNSILGSHEHRGACQPIRAPMNEFCDWSNINNFIHLPTRGVQFTWSNGKDRHRHTERRLDRVICNQDWLNACNSLNVSTLVKHKSDYFPLLLEFDNSIQNFVSQFKFMQMWTKHKDCHRVIQEVWNTNIVGCHMFILSQKLKLLKTKLKVWNNTVFGNVHNMVKTAEQNLALLQSDIDMNGLTDSLMEQHRDAQFQMENALQIEEEYWREKSKVAWHSDGDRNTKYYHRLTKIKNTSKLITTLMNGDNMVSDANEISGLITNHFKNIFATNNVVQDLQVNQLIDDSIPNLITDDVNTLLTSLPTPSDIHQAVLAMNKDGAPSPDGFGAVFFQCYWDIVKNDVINAVLEFFTRDWILPNFNANTIILIPKVPDAISVGQHRPIALANFKFKIISKILADRLAPFMNLIISPEQRGFIKGRNIKDGICIT